MPKVTLHQDCENRKAGEEVDSGEIDASRLKWLIGNGYASTDASRKTDHANEQTDVEAKHDPRDPANAAAGQGPERELTAPTASPSTGQNPPEAFDPDTRSVKEVEAYIKAMPEGAGRDAELARIKAVEAAGQNRDGIAKL